MDKTMVSVPVEPTEAMIDAARNFSVPGYCIAAEQWPRVWAAMLSAAPAPQPVQGEAVQIAAPGEGDMARALEDLRESSIPSRSYDFIAEAIAAYDPEHMAKCGNAVAAPGDVEQRARELLDAECIKRTPRSSALVSVSTALRAISTALQSQGQADAVELHGVRDTLIVAANNPVSHGGLGGLRELMLTQAHRITAALAQQANKDDAEGVGLDELLDATLKPKPTCCKLARQP